MLTRALLAGFPDRVAQRRTPRGERIKLAGGAGARMAPQSTVKDAEFLIAVGLDGGARGTEAKVRIAHAFDGTHLPLDAVPVSRFDLEKGRVIQRLEMRFLDLVVQTRPHDDPEAASACLAEAVARDPARAFDFDRETEAFLLRLRWLADQCPELKIPTFDELLPNTPPGPVISTLCAGHRKLSDLRKAPLLATLRGLTPHATLGRLQSLAPARMTLPDGSSKALKYTIGEPPVLAGRIQQFFGLAQTPRVLGGRMPVRLHLLAPNQRPQQVTQDLASFWAQGYPQVRKELRGRYPKHPWPEDPLSATPTGRAKPRKR
jgi:ATP-dependent helicase HrpB